MWKTFAYSISLAVFLTFFQCQVNAQDTLTIPLKINIGVEASGPAIYYSNKNISNLEGYISLDLNEKRSVVFAAGSLNYRYSQYNYFYMNKRSFVRICIGFHLLKPD